VGVESVEVTRRSAVNPLPLIESKANPGAAGVAAEGMRLGFVADPGVRRDDQPFEGARGRGGCMGAPQATGDGEMGKWGKYA
jgi:hypothetical protein